MPTVPTHAVVALTILTVGGGGRTLPPSLWIAGAVCAVLPDMDVIGFSYGIRYGDLVGHRGLTHSIFFAAVVAAAVTVFQPRRDRRMYWALLFLCTVSHGVLDAATDGGLGIAFFSPFSNQRYFWPFRPIDVSPIGLERFLSARGLDVIVTELRWIWAPCVALVLGTSLWRKAQAQEAA